MNGLNEKTSSLSLNGNNEDDSKASSSESLSAASKPPPVKKLNVNAANFVPSFLINKGNSGSGSGADASAGSATATPSKKTATANAGSPALSKQTSVTSMTTTSEPELSAEIKQDVEMFYEDEAKNATGATEAELDSASSNKDTLNVVFIGHVDAGKSTLGGHILYLTGMVDKRTLEKFEKEAKEMNRESWFYSWALDTNTEERSKVSKSSNNAAV